MIRFYDFQCTNIPVIGYLQLQSFYGKKKQNHNYFFSFDISRTLKITTQFKLHNCTFSMHKNYLLADFVVQKHFAISLKK